MVYVFGNKVKQSVFFITSMIEKYGASENDFKIINTVKHVQAIGRIIDDDKKVGDYLPKNVCVTLADCFSHPYSDQIMVQLKVRGVLCRSEFSYSGHWSSYLAERGWYYDINFKAWISRNQKYAIKLNFADQLNKIPNDVAGKNEIMRGCIRHFDHDHGVGGSAISYPTPNEIDWSSRRGL